MTRNEVLAQVKVAPALARLWRIRDEQHEARGERVEYSIRRDDATAIIGVRSDALLTIEARVSL